MAIQLGRVVKNDIIYLHISGLAPRGDWKRRADFDKPCTMFAGRGPRYPDVSHHRPYRRTDVPKALLHSEQFVRGGDARSASNERSVRYDAEVCEIAG